jgi:tetratricopeptide (TPR) repeat protein
VKSDRDATLKQAEKLLRQGKLDGAIAEYVRLVEEQPRDWNSINVLGDLYVRAGDRDRAVEQFTRVADHMFAEGFLSKASALYKKALRVKTDDEHTLLQLSEIARQQGLLVDARQYLKQLSRLRRERGDERGAADVLSRIALLDAADADAAAAPASPATHAGADTTPASPATDAGRLFAQGRADLAAGRTADARMAFTHLMAIAPQAHADLQGLAMELATAGALDGAFVCTEVLVDDAVLAGDWDRALGSLERLLQRGRHIPALLKLVELAVDAGREDVVDSAQARLADAYIDARRADEARVIAEDLVARHPQSTPHVERLRRVLTLLGIDDAEAVVARYREPADGADGDLGIEPEPLPGALEPRDEAADGDAIVLDALEIDLSSTLADLGTARAMNEPDPAAAPDLDAVFTDLRRRVTHSEPGGDGSADYERGLRQLDQGQLAEAASSLRAAARRPLYRFRASARLGRLCLARGDLAQAV